MTPASAAPLEARLLGPLEIRGNGQRLGPTDLGGVKPKQLLEILLLAGGRTVSKDRIADCLWGEDLPKRVGATIETYVSVVRRRLDLAPGLGRRTIVTSRGGYAAARNELDRDVDAFEALIRHAAGADPDERRRALTEAIAMVADELLADERDASWVVPDREHYRALADQALVDLAECELELGDHHAVVRTAGRVLAVDPTNERAARALMLAHYELGAANEASGAFERCRSALAEELGVDPTTQTVDLHIALLRGEVPASSPARDGRRHRASALPVKYADHDGVRIAYQTVGSGPIDLVFCPSHITNLAATWDDPVYAGFLRRLSSMARLILFDKRGTGLSDPALDFPTQQERSEDLVSVLDAVGSERAVLFGVCGGGALCVQVAADHPDRTAGLILHNSFARALASDDYPWGMPADLYEQFLTSFEEAWLDESERIARRNPGLVDNPRYRSWFAGYVRLAGSPYLARRLAEMNTSLDIRSLLPKVATPCLVVTRTEDVWMSPENSRYLAEHIETAELLELPGVDHDPWVGDTEQVHGAVERFIARLPTQRLR